MKKNNIYNQKKEQIKAFIMTILASISINLAVKAVKNFKPIYIKNKEDITNALGYTNISLSSMSNAIKENNNIDDKFKKYIYYLALKKLEQDNNFDLRIYYENIKTLKIQELNSNDLQKEYQKKYHKKGYISGFYDTYNNVIYILEDSSEQVIYHELEHVLNNIYYQEKPILSHIYIKDPSFYIDEEEHISFCGQALEEAMTNKGISNLVCPNTYQNEGLILEYFLSCLNYTYEEYHEYGLNNLINNLTSLYPDIDILKIIKDIDKMKANLIATGMYDDDIFNNICDECFLLCLKNIDYLENKDNIYSPFINYVKLILSKEDNVNKLIFYLNKYNNELKSNGYEPCVYINVIKEIYQTYQNCEYLCTKKDIVLPCFKDEDTFYIYSNNEKMSISKYEYNICKIDDNISNLILENYLKYPMLYNENSFWHHLVEDNNLISPHLYKKINIYYKDNLITNDYVDDLYISILQEYDDTWDIELSTYDNEILLTSPFKNKTNQVRLKDYLGEKDFITEIKIEDIITKEFIISKLKEQPSLFLNMSNEDANDLHLMPLYEIKLKIDDIEITDYLDNVCLLTSLFGECYVNIGWHTIFLSPLIPYEIDVIYLKDVLTYYNMFSTNKIIYEFTEDDIISLFSNYLDEQKYTLKRTQ